MYVLGKEWIGELKAHEKSCGFVEVECPKRCGVKHLLRKDIEDHIKKECSRRTFSCPWCNETGEYKTMTDYHVSRCPKLIVTCPNAGCGMKMTQEGVEDHRKKNMLLPTDIVQIQ